ncbi:hypothetical protein [Paenibacillus protaetiae]|uniref:Uncharacterized protein n=1 Tax=Paenibacillus protaetiae TaxID=2509456 RepID=A0A4P6F1N5_9BACL|nr:hypothetical protein [Paenibacillus protaetiae]QAY68039.1 hypothetical protein ET464_18360 [Paenibacillus protaetiae]
MERKPDVYIVLTDTGTLFTKTIKYFTKDPFNHASLAFDADLKEVYSFGRKSPGNPFVGGFVKEDMRGGLFRQAVCAVYRCPVTPCEYDFMRQFIAEMERDQELYRYNLLGVIALLFNIQMKREKAYFCSQFVADVFERSGIALIRKSPLLVKPGDFPCTPMLELAYEGILRAYVERNDHVKRPVQAVKTRTA